MLAFLKSLEFLEILRLLKLENFITMVRGNLGSATPPSVMALFWPQPAGKMRLKIADFLVVLMGQH